MPYPQRLRKEKMEAQYGKFLDMIRAVQINIPLVDVLARMPNYGKFLKELVNNKNKIKQISAAFLSDKSSAILQNKVPLKLRDPGSFLILCNFNKAFSCNVLADLGASINLMPYSLYAELSLETLKPTKMSKRLANRSFQYPVGIAENMLVEVGKFTFPADFVILEMEEDSKVPLILGRHFLHTIDAVIRVKQKQLNLGVRTERIIFHIDYAMKNSYSNDDTCFSIDVIDKILEEDFDSLLDKESEILHYIKGTILKEKLFAKFDEFIAMTADENYKSEFDTEEPPFEKITFNTDYKIKTSLEEPPMDLKLKPLPDNLEYVFLEEPSFLLVIISSQLSKENKNKCILAIFHDMIEESVEVFMDDFSIFRSYFDRCMNNLDNMLQRCKDAHLVLNWEKCHLMVKEGIVLGHKVSEAGLEVDKSKNRIRMTKVIKGEFEKIKDVKVEDVSLTCDTPLEVFNNEVSRLSGMDDDLFTYEVEVANIPCDSKMDDDSEHEADDDMGYDPSDVAFTEWLGSKFFNYKTMDHYTMKALWIYWIRGDDEVELTDEESSDDKDEVAEVFRIDTNLFNFETPMCKAFKEFNYLLQIDPDLLTKDIEGFKTYEDYKDDWIYEWNQDIPWVDEKPWTNARVWTKPTPDYKWYEALEDSELKDEALRNKAIMEGFIKEDDDESHYEQKR
ncbi:reverse transcriptase domain-containing protein [Tanacetum coccineum]